MSGYGLVVWCKACGGSWVYGLVRVARHAGESGRGVPVKQQRVKECGEPADGMASGTQGLAVESMQSHKHLAVEGIHSQEHLAVEHTHSRKHLAVESIHSQRPLAVRKEHAHSDALLWHLIRSL